MMQNCLIICVVLLLCTFSVEGVTYTGQTYISTRIENDPTDVIFQSCIFQDASTGLQFKLGGTPKVRHIKIIDSTFDAMQNPIDFWNVDFAPGSTVEIRDNTMSGATNVFIRWRESDIDGTTINMTTNVMTLTAGANTESIAIASPAFVRDSIIELAGNSLSGGGGGLWVPTFRVYPDGGLDNTIFTVFQNTIAHTAGLSAVLSIESSSNGCTYYVNNNSATFNSFDKAYFIRIFNGLQTNALVEIHGNTAVFNSLCAQFFWSESTPAGSPTFTSSTISIVENDITMNQAGGGLEVAYVFSTSGMDQCEVTVVGNVINIQSGDLSHIVAFDFQGITIHTNMNVINNYLDVTFTVKPDTHCQLFELPDGQFVNLLMQGNFFRMYMENTLNDFRYEGVIVVLQNSSLVLRDNDIIIDGNLATAGVQRTAFHASLDSTDALFEGGLFLAQWAGGNNVQTSMYTMMFDWIQHSNLVMRNMNLTLFNPNFMVDTEGALLKNFGNCYNVTWVIEDSYFLSNGVGTIVFVYPAREVLAAVENIVETSFTLSRNMFIRVPGAYTTDHDATFVTINRHENVSLLIQDNTFYNRQNGDTLNTHFLHLTDGQNSYNHYQVLRNNFTNRGGYYAALIRTGDVDVATGWNGDFLMELIDNTFDWVGVRCKVFEIDHVDVIQGQVIRNINNSIRLVPSGGEKAKLFYLRKLAGGLVYIDGLHLFCRPNMAIGGGDCFGLEMEGGGVPPRGYESGQIHFVNSYLDIQSLMTPFLIMDTSTIAATVPDMIWNATNVTFISHMLSDTGWPAYNMFFNTNAKPDNNLTMIADRVFINMTGNPAIVAAFITGAHNLIVRDSYIEASAQSLAMFIPFKDGIHIHAENNVFLLKPSATGITPFGCFGTLLATGIIHDFSGPLCTVFYVSFVNNSITIISELDGSGDGAPVNVLTDWNKGITGGSSFEFTGNNIFLRTQLPGIPKLVRFQNNVEEMSLTFSNNVIDIAGTYEFNAAEHFYAIDFQGTTEGLNLGFFYNQVISRGGGFNAFTAFHFMLTESNFTAIGNQYDIEGLDRVYVHHMCLELTGWAVDKSQILLKDEVASVQAVSPDTGSRESGYNCVGTLDVLTAGVSTLTIRNLTLNSTSVTSPAGIAMGVTFKDASLGTYILEDIIIYVKAAFLASCLAPFGNHGKAPDGSIHNVHIHLKNWYCVSESVAPSLSFAVGVGGPAEIFGLSVFDGTWTITDSVFHVTSSVTAWVFNVYQVQRITTLENNTFLARGAQDASGIMAWGAKDVYLHKNIINVTAMAPTAPVAAFGTTTAAIPTGANFTLIDNYFLVFSAQETPTMLTACVLIDGSTLPFSSSYLLVDANRMVTNGTGVAITNHATNDVTDSNIIISSNQAHIQQNSTFFRTDVTFTGSNVSIMLNWMKTDGDVPDAFWMLQRALAYTTPGPYDSFYMGCNSVNDVYVSKFPYSFVGFVRDCATPTFTLTASLSKESETPSKPVTESMSSMWPVTTTATRSFSKSHTERLSHTTSHSLTATNANPLIEVSMAPLWDTIFLEYIFSHIPPGTIVHPGDVVNVTMDVAVNISGVTSLGAMNLTLVSNVPGVLLALPHSPSPLLTFGSSIVLDFVGGIISAPTGGVITVSFLMAVDPALNSSLPGNVAPVSITAQLSEPVVDTFSGASFSVPVPAVDFGAVTVSPPKVDGVKDIQLSLPIVDVTTTSSPSGITDGSIEIPIQVVEDILGSVITDLIDGQGFLDANNFTNASVLHVSVLTGQNLHQLPISSFTGPFVQVAKVINQSYGFLLTLTSPVPVDCNVSKAQLFQGVNQWITSQLQNISRSAAMALHARFSHPKQRDDFFKSTKFLCATRLKERQSNPTDYSMKLYPSDFLLNVGGFGTSIAIGPHEFSPVLMDPNVTKSVLPSITAGDSETGWIVIRRRAQLAQHAQTFSALNKHLPCVVRFNQTETSIAPLWENFASPTLLRINVTAEEVDVVYHFSVRAVSASKQARDNISYQMTVLQGPALPPSLSTIQQHWSELLQQLQDNHRRRPMEGRVSKNLVPVVRPNVLISAKNSEVPSLLRHRQSTNSNNGNKNKNARETAIQIEVDPTSPGTKLTDVQVEISFSAKTLVSGTITTNNSECVLNTESRIIKCGLPVIFRGEAKVFSVTSELPSYYSHNAALVITAGATNSYYQTVTLQQTLQTLNQTTFSEFLNSTAAPVPGQQPDGSVQDPAQQPAQRGIFELNGQGRLHFLIPTMGAYLLVMMIHWLVFCVKDSLENSKTEERQKEKLEEKKANKQEGMLQPDLGDPAISLSRYLFSSHILTGWIVPCCYHCGNVHTTMTLSSILLTYLACCTALNEFISGGAFDQGLTIPQYCFIGFFAAGWQAMFRPVYEFLFSQYRTEYLQETKDAIIEKYKRLPPDLSLKFGKGILADIIPVREETLSGLDMYDVFGGAYDGLVDDVEDCVSEISLGAEGEKGGVSFTNGVGLSGNQRKKYLSDLPSLPEYPHYKILMLGTERLLAYIFSALLIIGFCIGTYFGTYKYSDAELNTFWLCMASSAAWSVFVFEFVIVGLARLYHWMTEDDNMDHAASMRFSKTSSGVQREEMRNGGWLVRHAYPGEKRDLTRDDESLILKRHETIMQETGPDRPSPPVQLQ